MGSGGVWEENTIRDETRTGARCADREYSWQGILGTLYRDSMEGSRQTGWALAWLNSPCAWCRYPVGGSNLSAGIPALCLRIRTSL